MLFLDEEFIVDVRSRWMEASSPWGVGATSSTQAAAIPQDILNGTFNLHGDKRPPNVVRFLTVMQKPK